MHQEHVFELAGLRQRRSQFESTAKQIKQSILGDSFAGEAKNGDDDSLLTKYLKFLINILLKRTPCFFEHLEPNCSLKPLVCGSSYYYGRQVGHLTNFETECFHATFSKNSVQTL